MTQKKDTAPKILPQNNTVAAKIAKMCKYTPNDADLGRKVRQYVAILEILGEKAQAQSSKDLINTVNLLRISLKNLDKSQKDIFKDILKQMIED